MGLINDDLLKTGYIDYTEVFNQEDTKRLKEKISKWIDEHCSFSANLETEKKNSEAEKDYEITDDLIINVNSNINVRSDDNFPDYIRFGKVAASFFMMGQKLTKTDGFPTEIGESLWLYDNALEEITDFPTYIGGNCCLRHNKFKNLNGVSLNINGNLDVCDNDENFDYSPRTDGQTISVGVSFYGSLNKEKLDSNKNNDPKYIGIGGDKEEDNISFAKYLDEVKCPIKVGMNSKKGYIWHSRGDI